MMRIAVITEDSDVKILSKKGIFKKKGGKGIQITKSKELLETLKLHNISSLPINDIENENIYKKALHEYIKPAVEMFGGKFIEIKRFMEKLVETKNIVDLYIISWRYGLIGDKEEIIPYTTPLGKGDNGMKNKNMTGVNDVLNLYKKHGIAKKIQSIINNYDISIILLPSVFLSALYYRDAKTNFLEGIKKGKRIIFVGSKMITEEMKEYAMKKNIKVITFPRAGVARIGKVNRENILKIISSMGTSEDYKSSKSEDEPVDSLIKSFKY